MVSKLLFRPQPPFRLALFFDSPLFRQNPSSPAALLRRTFSDGPCQMDPPSPLEFLRRTFSNGPSPANLLQQTFLVGPSLMEGLSSTNLLPRIFSRRPSPTDLLRRTFYNGPFSGKFSDSLPFPKVYLQTHFRSHQLVVQSILVTHLMVVSHSDNIKLSCSEFRRLFQ